MGKRKKKVVSQLGESSVLNSNIFYYGYMLLTFIDWLSQLMHSPTGHASHKHIAKHLTL
jgi:hypothetical protein